MAAGSHSFDDELVGLFELSQDAFCIAGFDGYLKHANPAFPRSLGYTLEQLLALPFAEHIHPDDRESVEAALSELAAGNPVVGFQCRHICADRSVRWFEWSTSSRPEAGVMYGAGRDVTERHTATKELSALRHVATLAAEGVVPTDLFAVVAEEVARVVDIPIVTVVRYELDNRLTVCATFPKELKLFPAGSRLSLDGTTLSTLVRDRSAAVRIEDYSQLDGEIAAAVRGAGARSTVGVPIVVAGRLWGSMAAWSLAPEPLPDDTAARLARFTELLATAIANAESHEALARLAEQQTALRRIATLVARSTPPSEVFAAVAEEMARCLGTTDAEVFRYDPDGAAVVVAAYIAPGARGLTVGERLTLEGDSAAARVLRTGRPARMDSYEYETADGTIADRTHELGPRSRAGAPIIVDAHVWGVALVGTSGLEPLPSDIEGRIAEFADLVATAIANTATREELLASRARIVAAADDARRRIERNLHDGAQQRLVALGLELRAAEACVPDELQPLKERIAGLVTIVTGVSAEVQEISRGLHPAILSRGGLAPALRTLARRCTVPVDLDLHVDQRLPDTVEVGAYYIVAEALTNAAKHARASVVEVCAEATNSHLRLEIRDDGIGGAAPGNGSGLTGLVDRVAALGGTITIQSQPGSGTSLLVGIPIESD